MCSQAKDSSFIGQDQKILVKQVPPGYKTKMCDAVKATVWGLFKFLSTNPEDCAKVYTLARRGMEPKIKGRGKEDVGVPTFYPNCLCCEQDRNLLSE
jgi:hypothetical protein